MQTAINRGIPDRLPVTTHHLMPSFLNNYMDGIDDREFFDIFGMDAILWINPFRDLPGQVYAHPDGYTYNDEWRITAETLSGHEYDTIRYTIHTPGGALTLVVQQNEHTKWLSEHPIKRSEDIDLLGKYMPSPVCDVSAVNQAAEEFAEAGPGGGYILSPSDHFFEADINLLTAFADEARRCHY